MEGSHDGDLDTESCTESVEDKKCSESYLAPAYINSMMRRAYLQEMVRNLPASVQNRVTVLKNMQLELLGIEAEFFEEVYKLEKKYQLKYQPLFDKRKEIVVGEVDPPKEEPKFKVEEEEENKKDFSDQLRAIKSIPKDVKGIPDFWLTIFKNTDMLSEMVQDHDEPVLKKLKDIQIKYDEDHSYTLEFYFDKNEYFSNPVLTKKYFLKAVVDEDDPFSFEGPEIYKCKGCNINWAKTMNLTVKTIRKKQKHKERGAVRTIVKQVPNDSFFNFFNPPEIPEDKSLIDDESQGLLATDFEIGHYIRARIIPKAILYYTGDIIDDEDDEDEYDGEEEEDDMDETGDEHKTSDGDHDDGNSFSKKNQQPNDCPNQ